MKYSASNPPLACMQTTSSCYKGTSKMAVKGILWHSTGANNPNLKRYVQPSDNAKDRAQMLKILGTNNNRNDWNHISRQAGLNAWIGKLADGTVAAVQTMPWDYKPWGCGSGKYGSCNNGWIQFEICEDDLQSKSYFEAIYREAVELTAYLCQIYKLDPTGSVKHSSGVKCPVVLCHQDSYKLGLGSNHGDIYHWFNRYGKSMEDVRQDVAACMKTKGVEDLTKEETLKLVREEIAKIQIPDAAGICRNIIGELDGERKAAPASGWAKENIDKAKTMGLTDGTRPQDYMTRQEAAVLALRILGTGGVPGKWSEEARTWAIKNALVNGTGADAEGNPVYDWASLITREQVVTMLYRVEQLGKGVF